MAKRSKKEQHRIRDLHEEGRIVFLNNKGRLCFRQMYPDFPMYISIISSVISILVFIIVTLLAI